MNRKAPANVAASVRRKLLNYARRSGDEFQRVLDRYGAERFLFRLGRSPHAERVVLKGAMLFFKWAGEMYRPTRDLAFDGRKLSCAIASTFERRRTEIPEREPLALSAEFGRNDLKRTQWRAFLQKGPFKIKEENLERVIASLRHFLMPPSRTLSAGCAFNGTWPPGGPWCQEREEG